MAQGQACPGSLLGHPYPWQWGPHRVVGPLASGHLPGLVHRWPQHWSSEPLRTCLPWPTASCWASHQDRRRRCRDHVIQVPAPGGPATQTVLATPLAKNPCGRHQSADTPSDTRICWAGGGSERAGQDLSLKRTWMSEHTEAVPKPLQHSSPGLPAPAPSIPLSVSSASE